MPASVSVIIPNYNYGKYLEATVGSILSQTHPVLEIIVIDNGSTDDSRTYIERLTDSRVKKVFQKNLGQAGARNSGLREATGEFIAFLDADDIWLPEKLAKQMALFSRSEVGLVYCGLKVVSSRLEPLSLPDVMPRDRGKILDKFAIAAASPVCGGESTAVVRASVLKAVGNFEAALSIGTGWDMWRRIAATSEVDFVPEALVLYRQHGTNQSRRLDVYSHDTELKLDRMFNDPTGAALQPLRSRAYAFHRMAMAGAYIQAYQPHMALYWGIRAFFSSPRALIVPLGWPFRFLKRRLFKEKDPLLNS